MCLLSGGCSSPRDPVAAPSVGVPSVSAPSAVPVASGSSAAPPTPPGPLDVEASSFDFSRNPELTGRIAESAHAYFRFVGHKFSAVVCKRFAGELGAMPRVRLHGDPHVEQYAVTDLGRWMSDYDDAAVGPAVVDLVRMATSIVLAARQHQTDPDPLLAELFRGYADGLENRLLPKDPPAFAAALKSKFTSDRKGFLEMAEKNVLPIEQEEGAVARARFEEYVDTVSPKRPNGFFTIKKEGRLKLGIGSALTKKYLFRVEGRSKAEEDDVIVEIKAVADLSEIGCVQQVVEGAADARAAEQKLAPGGRDLLTPRLLKDRKYWVNEWLANYQEARIKKLAPPDLVPLVYEAGLMLGLEHRKPLPDGAAPKPAALALGDARKAEISRSAKELADAATTGWERFKRDIAKPGP